MTETELYALPHITVLDASEFLQREFSPQHIRVLAQAGRCPFCTATKNQSKWSYHVNVGRLVRYKDGDLDIPD